MWEYAASEWKLEGSLDWDKDEKRNVEEFSWMSEVLDAEEAALLEKISEETFGHPMYAMPYLYMEGVSAKTAQFSCMCSAQAGH